MSKKGFTIVELLAVIIVLAAVMALAVPSITNSANGTKEKTYQTKVSLIENAAVIYAQDNYRTIIGSGTESSTGTVLYRVTVNTLASEGLLNTDTDDGKVLDPRDNSVDLNSCEVEIEIVKANRHISARYIAC